MYAQIPRLCAEGLWRNAQTLQGLKIGDSIDTCVLFRKFVQFDQIGFSLAQSQSSFPLCTCILPKKTEESIGPKKMGGVRLVRLSSEEALDPPSLNI